MFIEFKIAKTMHLSTKKRFSSTRRLPSLQPVNQSHLGTLLGIPGDLPESPGDPPGEELLGIPEEVAFE